MLRYLTQLTFTDQGAKEVAASVTRANAFRESVQESGGVVEFQYWCMGDTDGVVVFQVPDEATAARLLISLAADGNVRTSTVRAFDATEFATGIS